MNHFAKPATALLCTTLLLLAGCGRTVLRIDSTQPYDIYVDDQKVGTSTAVIPSAGIPHKALVEARDSSGVVRGSAVMRREFLDWRTLVLGLCTSGIGLLVWYYPDQFDILLYEPETPIAPPLLPPEPPQTGCQKTQNVNMAILPLIGNQFNPSEMDALSARLETELMNRTSYNYLERRNMELILSEQGFQQSGTCANNDCQLQMGQMLGVDHIITGTISRVGTLTTMNIRILNVSNGKNEYSTALDLNGGLEQVLVQGSAQIAQQIARNYCPQ